MNKKLTLTIIFGIFIIISVATVFFVSRCVEKVQGVQGGIATI